MFGIYFVVSTTSIFGDLEVHLYLELSVSQKVIFCEAVFGIYFVVSTISIFGDLKERARFKVHLELCCLFRFSDSWSMVFNSGYCYCDFGYFSGGNSRFVALL